MAEAAKTATIEHINYIEKSLKIALEKDSKSSP